ncbi:hypothetical protein [Streptomyces sp. NPDC002785]|uniref:hypothetical protein n=1 Tax=Streptomyces sp. NPDC002785 TaxID=3154543 RepID=UPI00331C3DFF
MPVTILLPTGCGDAEVDGWSSGSALGFFALGAEKGEREVDAFYFAEPVILFGPS